MAITIKNVQQGRAAAGNATTASLGSVSIGDVVVVGAGHLNAGSGSTSVTDNAGNTYTKITNRNNGTSAGAALYYSVVTVANAALAVTYHPVASQACSVVAWVLNGCSGYNNDQASNAQFSNSTAFTVGPTTGSPPANSIWIYVLGASAAETSCPDPSGWNTTGSNGFTATMKTNAHQESRTSANVCVMGYIIASSVQTAALTLPATANWFGVVASFGPDSTAPIGNIRNVSQAVRRAAFY